MDSINFYQDYENEKYYFYAIAELDFSNLNKADISYLEKDDNFRLSINIDSEENHYDNEYMSLLSITNKNNIMYFSFALMSGDIYESLENGEYTIACNIQKDTYYLFNQEISSLDKSENIDKDIYNDMLNGINRINNNFLTNKNRPALPAPDGSYRLYARRIAQYDHTDYNIILRHLYRCIFILKNKEDESMGELRTRKEGKHGSIVLKAQKSPGKETHFKGGFRTKRGSNKSWHCCKS